MFPANSFFYVLYEMSYSNIYNSFGPIVQHLVHNFVSIIMNIGCHLIALDVFVNEYIS